MIGYHYTSYSNWLRIKQLGICPYFIDKEELKLYFKNGIAGIWLWDKNIKGAQHAGCILWQIATKNDHRIVKLKCHYSKNSVLKYESRRVKLYHNGHIGEWKYHERDAAIIVLDPISPKKIELVGEYDVVKLLK